jgi:hypothetical protein
MAIKVVSSSAAKVKTLGVAFADPTLRELGVADFVDNDLFSNMEVCSKLIGCGAFTFAYTSRSSSNFL